MKAAKCAQETELRSTVSAIKQALGFSLSSGSVL